VHDGFASHRNVDFPAKSSWDVLEESGLGGDVLADCSVAACEDSDQLSAFVGESEAGAVDFGRDVVEGVGQNVATVSFDVAFEFFGFVGVDVVQRSHWEFVFDFVESGL